MAIIAGFGVIGAYQDEINSALFDQRQGRGWVDGAKELNSINDPGGITMIRRGHHFMMAMEHQAGPGINEIEHSIGPVGVCFAQI